MLRALLLAAGLALLTGVLSVLGTLRWQPPLPPDAGAMAEIALEHEGAASLAVQIVSKGARSLVTIAEDSRNPVKLSVPERWQRGEVHAIPLAELTEDTTTFGFRRYAISRAAGITFEAPTPETLTVHHTSKSPLKITITVVDLLTGKTFSDVRLLQEEKTTICIFDC